MDHKALDIFYDHAMTEHDEPLSPRGIKRLSAALELAERPVLYLYNMDEYSAVSTAAKVYRSHVADPFPSGPDLPSDVTHVVWTSSNWGAHMRMLDVAPSNDIQMLCFNAVGKIKSMLRNSNAKVLCVIPKTPRKWMNTFIAGYVHSLFRHPKWVRGHTFVVGDTVASIPREVEKWVEDNPVRFNR